MFRRTQVQAWWDEMGREKAGEPGETVTLEQFFIDLRNHEFLRKYYDAIFAFLNKQQAAVNVEFFYESLEFNQNPSLKAWRKFYTMFVEQGALREVNIVGEPRRALLEANRKIGTVNFAAYEVMIDSEEQKSAIAILSEIDTLLSAISADLLSFG